MNTNIKGDERRDGGTNGAIGDIEALLPWFAAGTLSRKDAARVEEALARDADLSHRFELVREELGEAIRLNESLGAPSTRAMKTLFEKIDAEAPSARRAHVAAGLSARITGFIESLSPRTLAWSGAAAAFAILLQAGVITGVLMQERGGYDLASHPAGMAAAEGAFAQIRFAPEATAEEITKFLQASKASIVSGPAAGTGMYRVRVAVTGLPKDELARRVKEMSASKVVGFAAPVQ